MARDTRRKSAGDLAPTVTSAVLVCLALALALLGHIRLKADLNRVYSEIGRLDRDLAEVRRVNRKLQMDYATLISSDGLSRRLRQLRLDLMMPGDGARIVLPEPLAAEGPEVSANLPDRRPGGGVNLSMGAVRPP